MQGKKELRKELLEKRDSLNSLLWNEYSNTIQKNIMKSDLYLKADCFLCYHDFHGEVGTFLILEDALLKGKEVYLPKVKGEFTDSSMDFYRILSTNDLVSGYKGIMEPMDNPVRRFVYEDNLDKNVLMLAPGVGFDKEGHRMGYGKGYYDHFLKDKPDIVKCGVCFSLQCDSKIPFDEYDITMDIIINELTDSEKIDEIKYTR